MAPDAGERHSFDIANASISDALAAIGVNPETGLATATVNVRRKENGYNEVSEKTRRRLLIFLGTFWGISAWMLELIIALSALLNNYSDLIVVGVTINTKCHNAFVSLQLPRNIAPRGDSLTGRGGMALLIRRPSRGACP